MRKQFMIMSIGFGMACLSGCLQLLPDAGPQPLRMDLSPVLTTPQVENTKLGSLKLILPTAPDSLDSLRISIIRSNEGITVADYLAGVEWRERLPVLVQQRLLEALSPTGCFTALGLQADKFNADYILQIHIHHFEIEQKQEVFTAHLEITATLLRRQHDTLIQQKTFHLYQPVLTPSLAGFLQALDTGFQNVQRDFIRWLAALSVISMHKSKVPLSTSQSKSRG
jgi:cholesterol transport system auxiliary component